ncbi:hypothetical protein, partial [Streptomyces sp. MUM 136J]|uniref:hypothetical protein n=1 Tax=Streptomyces sp. MUM 136J TaxID=2791992 RepID=UPI001F03FA52
MAVASSSAELEIKRAVFKRSTVRGVARCSLIVLEQGVSHVADGGFPVVAAAGWAAGAGAGGFRGVREDGQRLSHDSPPSTVKSDSLFGSEV